MEDRQVNVGDTWYRYEDIRYASFDDDGDRYGDGRVTVNVQTFTVEKITPKGVWINIGGDQRRFILTNARKKFAHPNKDAALLSFVARKERQISILSAQLKNTNRALAIGKHMKTEENKKEFDDIYSLSL